MTARRSAPTDVFAALYDLLASAYLYGPAKLGELDPQNSGELIGVLEQIEPVLARQLCELLSREALSQDEEEFLERIVIPTPGRYVPPYASVHIDGVLWGPATSEVLSWYSEEELVWEGFHPDPLRSRILAPDHIGVELAYLSIISERYAGRSLSLRMNSRSLMALLDHLISWLPRFLNALQQMETKNAGGRGVAGWTDFTIRAVEIDLNRRRANPTPIARD